MTHRFSFSVALLLIASLLVLLACGDGEATPTPDSNSTPAVSVPTMVPTQSPTPQPPTPQITTPTPPPSTPNLELTPTPQPATTPPPPPTPAPTPQLSTLDQLKKNAAEFRYEIGSHGGTYTFATISEPLTFNFALSTDTSSSNVLGRLFEGLTETSWLDDKVEPALAESWQVSEDGLTWTFRIRQDVQWHDGQPFTAHDVDFTFNDIIYNPDIDASDRATFHFRSLDENGQWQDSPMTVQALDDYTVECVLPVPFAPFLRYMGTAIFPKHILKQHVDDGSFATTWAINTDPTEIIGTGPFTIETYAPGDRVVFRRNPNYWMQDADGNNLPYLDRIVQIIVPESGDVLDIFLSGESDTHGVLGEELAQLELLQQDGNFTIHKRGPGFGTTFLAFNMNPGQDPDTGQAYLDPHKLRWFTNTKFRQAVAHAVDKDAIIQDVQHGVGYPQWSSVSPSAGDFHNP